MAKKKSGKLDMDALFKKAEANVKKLTGREFLKLEDYDETYGIPGYLPFNLPNLDMQCGCNEARTQYGIPRGRVVELQGRESSFKTTLCHQLAAEAIDQGGHVYWLSSEGDFDESYARKHITDHALDPKVVEDRFKVLPVVTIHDLFNAMRGLMGPLRDAAIEMEKAGQSPTKAMPPNLIILDSMSAFMSGEDYARTEKDGIEGETRMGGHAAEMHRFFKFFLIDWMRTGTTFVFTSHLRANLGFGNKKTKPAHDMVTRHYCHLRLHATAYNTKGTNSATKIDYQYGKVVKINVMKERNRDWVGTGEVQLIYANNYGWDIYLSIVDMLLQTGVGQWSGSEIVIDDEDPVLMELNGTYSVKELKRLLDSNVERIPEYTARAMRRGPAVLPDKRLSRGGEV